VLHGAAEGIGSEGRDS